MTSTTSSPGILGNLSLLQDRLDAARRAAELLGEAEAAARRAQALTRQLLTFARGGAPAKALLDLGPLVRETAQFASRGAAGTCRVDVPEGLWVVEADPGQIGQVVQNLVLNALEAQPDGEVEVSLANVQREPPASPAGPCSGCGSPTTGRASPPTSSTASSTRSSRPSRAAPDWGWP